MAVRTQPLPDPQTGTQSTFTTGRELGTGAAPGHTQRGAGLTGQSRGSCSCLYTRCAPWVHGDTGNRHKGPIILIITNTSSLRSVVPGGWSVLWSVLMDN